MDEHLRYYIAFNGGLKVLQGRSSSVNSVGEYFAGRTVDSLTGCRERPQVVFAAVALDGGYRSQDGGQTWKKVLDGDLRTFAVDPHDDSVVYAGMGPVSLLRSEDGGSTWRQLDGLLRFPEEVKSKWSVPVRYRGIQHPHVRCVFIHPDDSSFLFVLLEHGGVFISRDRGETWENASSGISYLDMHYLNNFPNSKDRYYVSSARGFFRSDDCGNHWRRVEKGMPWADTELYSYSHDWHFLSGDPPRMVLAGAKGSPGVWSREKRDPEGYILLSDDGGENWRLASDGLPERMPWMPWALVRHPTDPETLFAGMGDGARGFGFNPKVRGDGAFYVTRNRGDSWEPVLEGIPSILTAWVAAE